MTEICLKKATVNKNGSQHEVFALGFGQNEFLFLSKVIEC